jgi:hypothetical protein
LPGGGRAEACSTSISTACTISASGNYNVTANFSATGSAITVNVSNVTINLNGHTITGGTGSGINGASASNVAVIGPGIITSFGGPAITLGANAIVQDVTALSNGTSATSGGAGISVGDSSVVSGCIAQSNGNGTNQGSIAGISCGDGCSLSGNVADSNAGSGIALGTDGAVINNSMYNNTQWGLDNTGSNTGFGENVMYNNSSGCAFSSATPPSEGNNVCNGSVF